MTLKNRLVKLEDQEAARRAAIEQEWERVCTLVGHRLPAEHREVLLAWVDRTDLEACERECNEADAWVIEVRGGIEPIPPIIKSWIDHVYDAVVWPRQAPAGSITTLRAAVEDWEDLSRIPTCPVPGAARFQVAIWKYYLELARILGEERS